MPILANADVHEAMVNAWKYATAWRVGRYVVMPDHVHLFVAPATPEDVSSAIPVELDRWMIFWKCRLARTLGKNIWQEGYWDRTLRSIDSYDQKWSYVLDNPVRKGLVEDASAWPYAGEINELIW